MRRYKAALFAPDGEHKTDYRGATVEEVWINVEDGGSRWYFYPVRFVITDRGSTRDTQRIVDAPDAFAFLKGRTLRTVARWMAENNDYLQAVLG